MPHIIIKSDEQRAAEASTARRYNAQNTAEHREAVEVITAREREAIQKLKQMEGQK